MPPELESNRTVIPTAVRARLDFADEEREAQHRKAGIVQADACVSECNDQLFVGKIL